MEVVSKKRCKSLISLVKLQIRQRIRNKFIGLPYCWINPIPLTTMMDCPEWH